MNKVSPIFLALLAAAVVGAILCGFTTNQVVLSIGAILFVIGGWAASLCLHEFGHAYVAYRGGDWTVQGKGYLTLDPRRYTSPLLSIVLPLVILVIGGIPLPGGAVFINHGALRNRKVESSVSLAGPGTNLVLAVVLTLVVAVGVIGNPFLAGVFSYFALLQLLAFIINILPIPGLDGWGAIEPWLSPAAQRFGAQARPWAPLVLLLLIIGIPSVASWLFYIANLIFGAVGGESLLAGLGAQLALPWRY